jgi:hypothetical protein
MSLADTDYNEIAADNKRLYKRVAAIRQELWAITKYLEQDVKTKAKIVYYQQQIKQREAKIDKTVSELEARKAEKTSKLDKDIQAINDKFDAQVAGLMSQIATINLKRDAQIGAIKAKQETIENQTERKIDEFNDDYSLSQYTTIIDGLNAPDTTVVKTKRQIQLEKQLEECLNAIAKNSKEQKHIENTITEINLDSQRMAREKAERDAIAKERAERDEKAALQIGQQIQKAQEEADKVRKAEEDKWERHFAELKAKSLAQEQAEFEKEVAAYNIRKAKVDATEKELKAKRAKATGIEKEELDELLGYITIIKQKRYSEAAVEAYYNKEYDA